MSEPLWQRLAAPADPLGRALFHVCRWLAVAGGFVLLGMTVMSVASIGSRWLTGRSLLGDFELVQMGCAIAVAAFLPWTQMRRGHVIVDFFTLHVSERTRTRLDGVGALTIAAVGALVAWRVTVGTLDIRASGESSMLLGVPTWYAYACMLPSFYLLALAGLHTAWSTFKGGAK